MIFREIKITNKEPLNVQIPECWEDVSFSQFIDIKDEPDPLKRIYTLTNIPIELFETYPELSDFYIWLEEKLIWSIEYNDKKSKGEVFIIDGESFHFPENIGMHSVGLYKDIQSEVMDSNDNVISVYPFICSAYYQLHRDGKYDYGEAKKLISTFSEMPCRKIINCGGFFLNKVKKLKSGTSEEVRSPIIQQIKNWLGLIGFKKCLDLKQH